MIERIKEDEKLQTIAASILAVLGGLLVGFVIMLFSNPGDSFGAFFTILFGGFRSAKSFGDIFYFATPIIFTGLSVAFAFKTGLFNIGASGQFTVGAFTAIYIGVKWTFLPPIIHPLVAMVAAMIVGALWAALPGMLKAYRNVHEVVATIMMNYIAMYITKYLITVTVFNQTRNESQPVVESAVLPNLGMDKIFGGSSVNVGIIIAILTAVTIWYILYKTTFGFELRAVGFNRDAAKYAGINEKRGIIFSMMIAGALAGLGGSVVYLNDVGKHLENVAVLLTEGFDGIPVALLASSHPLGVIFAGIFIGYLKVGGFYMQLFAFSPEIIDIIVATIIYFSALSLMFKDFIIKIVNKRLKGGAN